MTLERLKILLFNAIILLADDGYEKDKALYDLDMTEAELNEILDGEEINFIKY